MRAGGGKQKGGAFERSICKELSLAVSKGTREDYYWRSAMSGGRATVSNRRVGPRNQTQVGDISCIDPAGAWFTDLFAIECKFVKDLNWDGFLLEGVGPLAKFWAEIDKQAAGAGKQPMLIAKENRRATLVVTNIGFPFTGAMPTPPKVILVKKALSVFWWRDVLADILSGVHTPFRELERRARIKMKRGSLP